MLDYKGIQALYQVVHSQSFEVAANKLFISQSAISQRIKALEEYYSCPLMTRTLPYEPTSLGSELISHYQQFKDLEESFLHRIDSLSKTPKVSIAISRDSLESWFHTVIDRLNELQQFTIEIISDDQDVTIDYVRKGLVSSAISTAKNALSGCEVELLGHMIYVLVASPQFKAKYFDNDKPVTENLLKAPTVKFDYKDVLYETYMKDFFNITDRAQNFHTMPSAYGFKALALHGSGYALIPEISIREELQNGQLVDLFPEKHWRMPLYWHTREIKTPIYKAFDKIVRGVIHQYFNQNNFGK